VRCSATWRWFSRSESSGDNLLLGHFRRYEFHNKGFDILLESLAALQKRIARMVRARRSSSGFSWPQDTKECTTTWRHRITGEAVQDGRSAGIVTHHLYDERNDPIVQACLRLDLRNAPESKISVIFVPAYLDGHDGFFNMPYYEVLSACDLGIFPSYYEPWGYTPLESIALGVPTVTTDLTGFGLWAHEQLDVSKRGLVVITRTLREDQVVMQNLTAVLEEQARISKEALADARQEARRIARLADWSKFFDGYRRAYEEAAGRSNMRFSIMDTSAFSDNLFAGHQGAGDTSPQFRTFTVVTTLPEQIEGLRELAHNLWWVWHPDARSSLPNSIPRNGTSPTIQSDC